MSRLAFNTDTFRCRLDCDQCTHIKDNGQQCRNRVCFGIPVCWVHSIQVHGVTIRPSTIPGAGKGLFAVGEFEEDKCIGGFGVADGMQLTASCL